MAQYANEILTVNQDAYRVIRLLGKGKGGYSYHVSDGQNEYVLKQIHHEPCAYYEFGNKLEAECRDYQRLLHINIPMPQLLAVDVAQERILKAYIPGNTIYQLVLLNRMQPAYWRQIRGMSARLYAEGLNIDYFPTNFIVQQERLFYVDYECNAYMKDWDFESWGCKYWARTTEFLEYVHTQLGKDSV